MGLISFIGEIKNESVDCSNNLVRSDYMKPQLIQKHVNYQQVENKSIAKSTILQFPISKPVYKIPSMKCMKTDFIDWKF